MERSLGAACVADPSEDVRDANVSSCFWCDRPHPSKHPLSLCPACIEEHREVRFPMGSLGMSGFFPLCDAAIDEMVRRLSPGNFALGYLLDSTFTVFLVGRSDSDVRSSLHEWVGVPSRYTRHAPASKAAWGATPRQDAAQNTPRLVRVGLGIESGYTHFAYSYARSPEEAFEQECRNYSDFGGRGGLDNDAPPAPPPS